MKKCTSMILAALLSTGDPDGVGASDYALLKRAVLGTFRIA